MLRRYKVALSLGAAAIVTAAVAVSPQHIGPAALYPNAVLTPGLIATQSFAELTANSACGTYSQCHRNTSSAQKTQVEKEYPACPAQHEIDHLVPLALGGADDVRNLWCQPEVNEWNGQDFGYHAKDKLETYLVIQMKAGTITPKDAQNCILQDWPACFQKFFSGQKFGSLYVPDDEDDVVVH